MELHRGLCSLHYCSQFTLISLLSIKDMGVDVSRMTCCAVADDETLLTLIFFWITYISNMCIYTLKKAKIKKILQGWCATPPNVPKLGVSGVNDTAKLTKISACHVT